MENEILNTIFNFRIRHILALLLAYTFIFFLIYHIVISNFNTRFSYKLKYHSANIFIIYLTILACIVSGIYSYKWYITITKATITTYIIYLLIVLMFSSFFTIIEYFIILLDRSSYIIVGIYENYLKSISSKESKLDLANLESLKSELVILLSEQNNIEFKQISGSKHISLQYIDYNYSNYCEFEIFNSKLIIELHINGHGIRNKYITNNIFIRRENIKFKIDNHISADQKEIFKILNKKDYCIFKIMLESKIKEIDIQLTEDNIENLQPTISFSTLLFNNFFELLSIKQSYLIPVSNMLLFVHFIFGLYKYLFLGILIALIIKK